MSFSAAARELSVTPAALSFQIKSLEEALGADLFVRRHRAIELTDAGQALAPGTRRAFEALSSAWQLARDVHRQDRLTVTTGPAFTAKWLSPRLGAFVRAHSDIELRFSTTTALLEFGRDGIDVAVRFGTDQPGKGVFCEDLLEELVLPAMRPEVAAKVNKPADLLKMPLIQDDSLAFLSGSIGWREWLITAGVNAKPKIAVSFNQADHAIDAALQASGVVLGRFSMLTESLRNGTLIAPFPLCLKTRGTFRLMCSDGRQDQPAIVRFRAWIGAEIARDQSLLKDFEVNEQYAQ